MSSILDPSAEKIIYFNGKESADDDFIKVGTLGSMVRAVLLDEMKEGENNMVTKTRLVQYGVKSWRLRNDKGEEIPCEREEISLGAASKVSALTAKSLDVLSTRLINRLFTEIVAINFVTEDQEKN